MRSKKNLKNTITLITVSLLSNFTLAESFVDEHALLIEIPTVTSATRLTQHLSDAPVSMTVIDRATVQASGAKTIPDLFRLVPGFQVAHVNTNKYAVTYHGHSDDFPRRLEVMIDGRSVYFPIISAVDWSSLGLHIEDIERIEVIRGSNTATYGSNAFMGAINIITRHPSTEPMFSASSLIGSLSTTNTNFRLSGSNSIGHFRLSGGHEKNNGSDLFHDGAQRNYLNFSGSFAPNLQDQIDIWLGIDTGHIRIGELKPARGLPENLFIPERSYDSNYQHIQWKRVLDNHLLVGVQAYQNSLRLDEQTPEINDLLKNGFRIEEATILLDNNPSFKFLNEDGATKQKDIEFFLRHEDKKLNSSSGIGIRKNTARSDTLFEQGKVESTRYRMFNNTSFSSSANLTWHLGFLHEKEESGSGATSIRGAINWHIAPQLSFRFAHSRSERLPSMYEKNTSSTIMFDKENSVIFDAIRRPNPTLSTEKIDSNEIGILYNLVAIPGHLDFRFFDEKITNGIESYVTDFPEFQVSGLNQGKPKNFTRIDKNISSWNNRGAEIQLKLRPDPKLWLLFNYTYIDSTKDGYFDGARFINRRLLAPKHSATALINWQPIPDINLSTAHYYIDKMNWVRGDIKEAYNRTDLRAAKYWTPSSQTQAEAAVVIQNAFGPAYKEFYDYHDFERRFFLTIRLKYN